MMYQMATGKLPFPGSSFGEVLIGHLQLPPPPIRELNPEVPEAYEAVIMKCLEKQQDNRYQSMQELHDAILGAMEQLGISRELPVADAAEVAAASGTKTKSSPGSGPRTPVKAAPKPALPRRTPVAATQAQQATAYQPPPLPPPKLRTGLFVGLGAGGVAVIGGIIFVLMQQNAEENRKASDRAAALVAQRQEAREAARKAEEAAKAHENEKVFLSVVSEPLGALAEATWKDGAKAAATPFDLSVPKNMKVHFAFSKSAYFPYATDVIADTPQVVKATLQPEPKPVAQKVPKSRDEESGKKAKPASDSKNTDDTIPVEF
jgi:hypothetical protein